MMQDKIIEKFIGSIKGIRKQMRAIYLFVSRARSDEKPFSGYNFLRYYEVV